MRLTQIGIQIYVDDGRRSMLLMMMRAILMWNGAGNDMIVEEQFLHQHLHDRRRSPY